MIGRLDIRDGEESVRRRVNQLGKKGSVKGRRDPWWEGVISDGKGNLCEEGAKQLG